ncbi:Uncharacterised protein [Porphyromonas crevioricanis]|uniref:Uncharacterized protein n=1 Tax=Porphyromonas crevioricanis TaxID=393921 RepID=A0A2X4PMR2_9PORP|nr:hypothetical protein SAMN02745203_01208 [Porphyromonas crevioricanis]SQH73675.1 Uncharacterised protein [Porphyromonas crevioricanis]
MNEASEEKGVPKMISAHPLFFADIPNKTIAHNTALAAMLSNAHLPDLVLKAVDILHSVNTDQVLTRIA